MIDEQVMYGGRSVPVSDYPTFDAALEQCHRDRQHHEHRSDVCECGPYRWPCPSCGHPVVAEGEEMADQVAIVGDGRCHMCFVGLERE